MARPASDISPRIVHAARGLFLTQGVDGASLREIAREAGTNIGMVYYYFKTKDDLFLAVVEEVYSVFLRDLTAVLAEAAPVDARLKKLYARVADMNETEFQVVRLILREALVSSARLQKIAARFAAGHLPLVLALLQEGIADGTLRPDRHPIALLGATFTLAIMPQVVHRLLTASELPVAKLLPPRHEAAQMLNDVLLLGIGGPKLTR